MFHKVTIVGYLGADPQLRYTPTGVPVTSFNVAASRRWDDDSGQHERTAWFRVTTWRRLAEICNEYLAKGRLVLVEGELVPDPETGGPRIWEDKEGNKRASYEVNAVTVKFFAISSKKGEKPSEEVAESEDEMTF